MATEVLMPKLGLTMTEGTIEKWYKKEASRIFKERLDYCYNNFSRKIPYPYHRKSNQ